MAPVESEARDAIRTPSGDALKVVVMPHPISRVARVRLTVWSVTTLVVAWLLLHIYHTLIVFGVSVIMTICLTPLVRTLAGFTLPGLRRPASWRASVVIVYVFVTTLIVLGCLAAVPAVVQQVQTLTADLPKQMPRLQVVVDDWQQRFRKWKMPPEMRANIDDGMHHMVSGIGDAMVESFQLMGNGLVSAFSWLLYLLAGYVIALFFLLTVPDRSQRFYSVIPEPYRTDVRGLLGEMNHIFGGFLRGMSILALCVGFCNAAMFGLLGMLGAMGVPNMQAFQYSLLVSVLSMIGYVVPLFGVVTVSLVAALLAWFQFPNAMFVVVVVLIINLSSNGVDRLLGPKIMSDQMGVSPLFVVFSAFAGAELFGFWGMILGVPAAAMVKAIWQYIYGRFLIATDIPEPIREPSEPQPAALP
ncbi:MAG: AI-2E family transporter [Candidatus Xenobia bacterium]